MTNEIEQEALDQHDAQVDVVTKSVGQILDRFGPSGLTPEAAFQGAIQGAMVMLMVGRGISADEAAEAVEDFARIFRMRSGENAVNNSTPTVQ